MDWRASGNSCNTEWISSRTLTVFIRYFVNFSVNSRSICWTSPVPVQGSEHRAAAAVQRAGPTNAAGLEPSHIRSNHTARRFLTLVSSVNCFSNTCHYFLCKNCLISYILAEMCRLMDWLLACILLLSTVNLELILPVFIPDLYFPADCLLLEYWLTCNLAATPNDMRVSHLISAPAQPLLGWTRGLPGVSCAWPLGSPGLCPQWLEPKGFKDPLELFHLQCLFILESHLHGLSIECKHQDKIVCYFTVLAKKVSMLLL